MSDLPVTPLPRKPMTFRLDLLLRIGLLLLVGSGFSQNIQAGGDKLVTFYPSYGYREESDWVIPMRLWVHERRSLTEGWITQVVAGVGRLDRREEARFRSRLEDFVADSESGERVSFMFDADPEPRSYRVQTPENEDPKTDLNGLVVGVVRINSAKAERLLRLQGSEQGWLSLQAVSKGHLGRGKVQLLEPTGLSVISDIDDTIKITQIPAGPKVVMANTLVREYQAVPEMAERYRAWRGAAFHYVSGGPWQLYRPLAEFLFSPEIGFPEGSFHMKNARKNLLNTDTWEDLTALVTNSNLTFEHKLQQISEILKRFPQRKFILVGDSGEKDPEVYREIQSRFPQQIQEILIRDLVDDRTRNSRRLEGMSIIPVPEKGKADSPRGQD